MINGTPLLEAKGLSKSYHTQTGQVQALDQVDLALRAGEFVALVGPTGSGKTTLLSLLAGLEPADAGAITLLGQHLSDLDDDGLADLRLRAVGMIYQSYNLFSGFTVRQNVRLPLQLMTRRPPFDATQRTNQLLADFGLPDLAERYPAELSGGQQQLAAIAARPGDQPAADPGRRANRQRGHRHEPPDRLTSACVGRQRAARRAAGHPRLAHGQPSRPRALHPRRPHRQGDGHAGRTFRARGDCGVGVSGGELGGAGKNSSCGHV